VLEESVSIAGRLNARRHHQLKISEQARGVCARGSVEAEALDRDSTRPYGAGGAVDGAPKTLDAAEDAATWTRSRALAWEG
jgi:hypothetical protein